MKVEQLLSDRTRNIQASAIREILKVVSQPGMISLAGGLPAPESFPLDIIGELMPKVIEKYQSNAFQYSLTEGFLPLREVLADFLKVKGLHVTAADIATTSGSQGLLDAVGKVFISRGDKVAVEAPTYLGALQAFNAYEPQYICMATDDQGVIPEALEAVLRNHKIKFIYLVPTFQNPTGRTLPLERRKAVAEIVRKYDALLIEDDPYSYLRYRGEEIPPIYTLAPENVLYAGTLSKILAPGFRIGFYIAPPETRPWLLRVKQGVDLHTSTCNQALAAEYIAGGYLKNHLPKIINMYRPKQEAMLNALDRYFPDSFNWSRPDGGMFIWAEGPKGSDMLALYQKAIERKVAFVPGKYFYTCAGDGLETMRLNYTMVSEQDIEKGIRILSEVIRDEL